MKHIFKIILISQGYKKNIKIIEDDIVHNTDLKKYFITQETTK